ncbi:MAG: hypothetical protein ABMA64_31755 [Myxococcota bacterium]
MRLREVHPAVSPLAGDETQLEYAASPTETAFLPCRGTDTPTWTV